MTKFKSFIPTFFLIVTAILICVSILYVLSGLKGFVELGMDDEKSLTQSNSLPKKFSWDKLEIASTEEAREAGLMNRRELCAKCGMLFIFDSEQMVSFWMKDTYVSLDMIFIKENGQIADIYQNAVPLDTGPRYPSTQAVKYVLETPAGFSQKNNLSPGHFLDILALLSSSGSVVEEN